LEDRTIGIIAVVPAYQFEFSAVYAATGVYFGKSGENALPHSLAEGGRRSRQGGGLAKQDTIAAHADFVCAKRASATEQKGKASQNRRLYYSHYNTYA
jgi:hypothetical protein